MKRGNKGDNSLKELQQYRSSETHRRSVYLQNRPDGVSETRASHEDRLPRLKTDFKKCSAFVKKMRNFTPEALSGLLRDVDSLNLSKYTSEIASAIMESRLNPSDLSAVVEIVIALHQKYESFTSPFLAALFAPLKGYVEVRGRGEELEGVELRRSRIILRLVLELFMVGVHSRINALDLVLTHILGPDGGMNEEMKGEEEEGVEENKVDPLMLSTFVKYGSEVLLGITPPPKLQAISDSLDVPLDGRTCLLPPAKMEMMADRVKAAYNDLSTNFLDVYRDLQNHEHLCRKDEVIHGRFFY